MRIKLSDALRITIAALPSGEALGPSVTEDGLKRGRIALEGPEAQAIFREAAGRLERAIQGGNLAVFSDDKDGPAIYAVNHTTDIARNRLIPRPGYHERVVTDVYVERGDLARLVGGEAAGKQLKRNSKGGRRAKFDPALIGDVVRDLIEKKGHPHDDPRPGWNSIDDVIKAVNEYLVDAGRGEMSRSRAYAVIGPYLGPTDS
jgi:hypothetical protein